MKKILFSLLMLCTTAANVLAVDVATAEELKAAIEADNGAYITLTADINISGLGTLCETFTGTIDGTTSSGRGRALTCASDHLFKKMEGATLKNIVLKDFNISPANASQNAEQYKNILFLYPCYGMIACTAKEGCKFENVLVENCDLRCDCSYVGAFVGYSDGSTFENCSVDNHSTIYAFRNSNSGSGHGGIVGPSNDIILDFGNSDSDLKHGGFVGRSDNDAFKNCVNSALVASEWALSRKPCFGGIVGACGNTKMESCINYGIEVAVESANYQSVYEKFKHDELPTVTMSHCGKEYTVPYLLADMLCMFPSTEYTGGMAGTSYDSSEFVKCVNLGPCYFASYEGGIVGNAYACKFDLCVNYGTINGRNDEDAFPRRGGIAGWAINSEISNCLNFGLLPGCTGNRNGIVCTVFYDENGTANVRNCLSLVENIPAIGSNEMLSENSGNNYVIGDAFSEGNWVTSVTSEMLASGIVAYWLNKGIGNRDLDVKPWRQNVGQDNHPVLNPDHDVVGFTDIPKTPISSCEQLEEFADRVNNGGVFENAELTNDIDMDVLTPSFVIGTENHPYRGIFDGKGHTINKQNITMQSGSAGTFGTLGTYAEIRNLTIGSDSQINGGHEGTGSIAGAVKSSAIWGFVTIENCGNKGTIYADKYAGGILGKVDCSDTIKIYVNNCYSMGDVKVYSGNSALLCGYMKNSGVVTSSWAYAHLSTSDASGTPFGINAANGRQNHFVGFDKTLNISSCYTFDSDKTVDKSERDKLQAGVNDEPSQYLSNGMFVHMLNGETNDPAKGLTWQVQLGSYPEFGNKGIYYTRQVSNEYGTICLPYALNSNDDIQYYTFTSVESDTNESIVDLHFEATDRVAAGKPALFRVKAAGTYTFSDAVDEDCIFNLYNSGEEAEWKMIGTFEQKVFNFSDSEEIYYISNNQIRNSRNTTIAPYRAYFHGPNIYELIGPSTAKEIRLVVEDEDGTVTALQLVGEDLVPMHNAEFIMHNYYNLNGQRVNANHRGIVIKNGKKCVNK